MITLSNDDMSRPSQAKLNGLRNACERLGYSGMHDPRFVAFVRSVVGVDHPRFLTNAQASVVIVELVMVKVLGTTINDLPRATQARQ